MPLYSYEGTDVKGKQVRGLVAAVSRTVAHQKLKERKIFPTAIEEDAGTQGGRAGDDDLAYTVLQLAALLKSGIPMDEALGSLAESAENAKLRKALARVQVRLREGESLSSSLTEDSIFPPMLVRMVSAGEEAGQPGVILERYANFLQDEIEHRRALQSALAYPIVLVSLSILLLIALVMFLTPVIQGMYESTGSELPAITQMMVSSGSFLREWGIFVALGAVALYFLISRSLSGLTKDRLKMNLPLLGRMAKDGLLARWARTLALLQGSGVPLVRSLQMSREVVDNLALDKELRGVEQAVERGDGLAKSLARVRLIPPLLQQFLRTGEKTGNLDEMLVSAASFYEKELARRRQTLIRWLEPCLICFMGVVVGFVVISALLPLSQLSAQL
ncbi:MAG: type II secretion system F family protein [bacterium]|jgi:type II secretory pathway component PulF|nr:type II secretion system F family protein [bacterium]